jgi:hypothetical protein
VNLADFVRPAGVIKDTFSRGGFPGINVSHDADVAHFLERDSASHKLK